jgi:hypothetical protein
MTYEHPRAILDEIAKEHPDADDQALLVLLINNLRERNDLQCWMDVSRAWFRMQLAQLERPSPEDRAAHKRKKKVDTAKGAIDLRMSPKQRKAYVGKKGEH